MDLCERIAFEIVAGDFGALPALVVHRAAMWRATFLGADQEAEDKAEAERGHWANRIWDPDGEFYAPPEYERLARFVWRSCREDGRGVDLPRMSQLPPD